MIVLASTHRAAIAERDGARDRAEFWHEEALNRAHSICELRAENQRLKAKLERFTAPRARDARGHFLPVSA